MNVVIILNYRAAKETVACAESLLKNCRGVDHVVIVDNDSRDGSVEVIKLWQQQKRKHKITLLVSPMNSGYAGGNNYGLRWALKNLTVDNFWIVNNDTYVDSDAFSPLLKALQHDEKQFVGSIIMNAQDGSVECYGGGKLYPLLGKSKLLGKGQQLEAVRQQHELPDYLMGCSLAFSASLIEKIGFMDEGYFMYSEEVDWQFKARIAGISLQVVPESRVFHYGSLGAGGRSAFYHYYRNRAAIRFNKRYYGPAFAVTSACILSLVTIAQEFRSPGLAWAGIKGAFKGVMMRVK